MRVAVTGAAGFIGSHLSGRLLAEGHEVTGIDNMDDFYDPKRKRSNVSPLDGGSGWKFEYGDIRDPDFLGRALADKEAVFHLAARPGVRPSFQRPALYSDVNVRGTAEVLEAASRCGVSRFIFGSSSSVYGDGAPTPFREHNPLGAAQSPYASTKVAGELLCRNLCTRFESVILLRFFTAYGPRQRPDLAIHKFARKLVADKPLPVYGDPRSFRDYTYVDDIVDGIVAALMTDEPWAVVNLGAGQPVTLEEMIVTLEEALGIVGTRDPLPRQEGDLERTWADITEARRLLGYSPRWTFADGIASFVDWFRSDHVPA